jgi:UDP-GlcNAc:undecaprenyl-phosphate GlcNAc-1-phosphate transferase
MISTPSIAILSAVLALILTPAVKWLAVKVNAVDRPVGRRRVHRREVPRLGGLAIFAPLCLAGITAFFTAAPEVTRLDGSQFLGLAVGCGLIFVLGIYDDIRGANAFVKLSVQFLAASVAYAAGIHIQQISTPFGFTIDLGIFDLPLTVLWLIGLTNAMNLLDGIDGLAAGVSAMGALTILVTAMNQDSPQVALLAAALLGALLGFLPYNFNPASIFLGDCGALFLGFLLGALPLLSGQKAATAVALLIPLVSLGIPIFDTGLAFIRRLVEGRHPFQADRKHLHHRLLDLGLNQRGVVLTLYAVSAILSAMAIFMNNASRIGALVILVAMGAGMVVAVRRLGIEEFGELWRVFRQGERRRRSPRARAMLVRNSIPLIRRTTDRAALEALLEDIRRNLGFELLSIRISDGFAPPMLGGLGEVAVSGSILAGTIAGMHSQEDNPWIATVEILPPDDGRGHRAGGEERLPNAECGMRSAECGVPNAECGMRNAEEGSRDSNSTLRTPHSALDSSSPHSQLLLGTVTATKPAWMRRRASENDVELLTWLADGVAGWLVEQWPELQKTAEGQKGRGAEGRPRILVVDGDPKLLGLLRRILSADYDVTVESDGEAALASARRNAPHLLLLDLKLPNLDGYAVCQAFRDDPALLAVPIVVLSAVADPAEKVRVLRLGAADYITKPFHVSELQARLARLLP